MTPHTYRRNAVSLFLLISILTLALLGFMTSCNIDSKIPYPYNEDACGRYHYYDVKTKHFLDKWDSLDNSLQQSECKNIGDTVINIANQMLCQAIVAKNLDSMTFYTTLCNISVQDDLQGGYTLKTQTILIWQKSKSLSTLSR